MRFLLIGCLICLTGFLSQAQSNGPMRQRIFVLQSDSVQIDSLSIIRQSFKAPGFTENIDYRINYVAGAFINLKIPRGTLVQVNYQCLPLSFNTPYRNKDPRIIQPEFHAEVNPYNLSKSNGSSFEAFQKSDGVQSSGSIMRGLSVGNSQNAIINANLNLQLRGKLNNEVDVLAAISDENNPIQPEGNTQELQDFDQVYVQFSKNANKLVVGDYLMTKPKDAYFLNYYKKSRGISAQSSFALKPNQNLSVGAQAAIARGRFQRNIIQGAEGNQGPYRLSGPNGEVFIIIISGTEAVYLDGERLTRGEQNDYTIDYNSGEIVFMPRRIITQYSRIIVEFQYSDRNYARTLLGVNTRWDVGKNAVYLNYYTEQDNKNQPFQQNLSDSNKLLLASVGDNLDAATISGATPVYVFSGKKILYRKIDSLGYNPVYVQALEAGSDTVFYELRFSYMGPNKGNYRQGAGGSNGRVFEWLEPKNGIPQGDFEPITKLIAPNRKQMLQVGAILNYRPNQSLKVEVARSDYDKNLYSELDKANDAGHAFKLETVNTLFGEDKVNNLKSEVNYEFTDKHFSYIERYRNVEFNRIWNRTLNNRQEADTGNTEHILNWRLSLRLSHKFNLAYNLGYYNKNNNDFYGYRHLFQLRMQDTYNNLQANADWIDTKQKASPVISAYQNQMRSFNVDYARLVRKVYVGLRGKSELSKFANLSDTLLNGSYSFQQGTLYVRSKDSSGFSYFAEYAIRLDQLPRFTELKDHTLSNEAKAGIGLLQKNFNRLNIDFTYRNFKVLDTAFLNLKPEQTLLSRVEYDYGFWKRLITANTYLMLGSGSELKRDYQYVEVPIGQGIYVWKDFNEDGIQQLNEFQPASFADKNLANYIKVYLPTTTLVRVNNAQFSQTLNINSFSNRRVVGFRKFINRFSDQAAMRFDRKVQAASNGAAADLFKINLPDTSLISLSSLYRNTLFFNRNNARFGLDFGGSLQKTKTLLTNGFDTRLRREYNLGGRINLSANWALTGVYNFGNRAYASEYFSQNNYRYMFAEWKPKLSYQYLQKYRVSINYNLSHSYNQPELGGESSRIDEAGAELRYSFVKIGVLNLKYSLYRVQFEGNINSPLAYDMLQGLSNGNNQIWSAVLQQRIGQNLQINISYEGRKSGNIPIIHTGKMEARYMF